MTYRFLADGVLLLHLIFVLFVTFGGLLMLRWPRTIWLHLPSVMWGAGIEFFDWYCPLTPLENALRRLAGESGYSGGFLEHYLLPLIYPGQLTVEMQRAFGMLVVAINGMIYLFVWRRHSRRVPNQLLDRNR